MKCKQWLHSHLTQSKYTRAGLAEAIGVSKPAVDKWLAGITFPRVHTLYYLCYALFPPEEEDLDNWRIEQALKKAISHQY